MVKNLIWLNTEILCGGFYANRRLKVVHVFYNHMYQSKVQFRIPVLSNFFFYKYFVVCICYIYIYTVKFRSWKAKFFFIRSCMQIHCLMIALLLKPPHSSVVLIVNNKWQFFTQARVLLWQSKPNQQYFIYLYMT